MSYKIKSLIYLLAFIISALVYYGMDQADSGKIPASHMEYASGSDVQELPGPGF